MKVVRVGGIKEYRDRHGRLRRYYRRKGAPSVPISTELEGTALAAEVHRLDQLYKPMTPVAGTLRVLVTEYREKSEHWERLRERTRADYQRVLDHLDPVMDHALPRFTPPVLANMRDKAKKRHGFKFANQILVTLKMVFTYGVQYGHLKENPAKDVLPARRPADMPDANRPWEPFEALALIDGAPIHIAAPIALAAYLGIRAGDVVKMSKGAIKDGLLTFTTSKTRKPMELPVCDDLWLVLGRYLEWRAETFKRRKKPDTVLSLFVTSRGVPWTDDGFRTSFGKVRDDLFKEGGIGEGVTFHGSRHGVSTILAEEGFEAQEVKHLLGHGSETMTEHYQRRAKRRKLLKAMAETVEKAYRQAGENVVRIDRTGNENV